MKFYSEHTKKFYDTEIECRKAESAFNKALKEKEEVERKKSEERKARAQKVEEARKKVEDARIELSKANENYNKVLTDFCKDYGAYHYSITSPTRLSEYLSTIFDI